MKASLLTLSALFLFGFTTEESRCWSKRIGLKQFESSLMEIPTGKFTAGPLDFQNSFSEQEAGPRKEVVVDGFRMSDHEVTNAEYLFFLDDLKRNDPDNYERMLPDTLVWRDKQGYNEPYVEVYFRHPAYWDYPVVGISYEQATAYCSWLTDQYNSLEKSKFGKVEFNLPTKQQWRYAAAGGMDLSPFSWGGPFMQNKKGQWLANFRRINQKDIGRKTETRINQKGAEYEFMQFVAEQSCSDLGLWGESVSVTAPAKSYAPNEYGLYNMCGNVEEFVREQGIVKGGSWNDTGFYLQIWVEEEYDPSNSASNERGFRVVMETL